MKKNNFKSFSFNLFLAVLTSLLFALSHPNYILSTGLPIIAYLALTPLFILIKRIKFCFSFSWGAFVGGLSYFLFNFWMINFHPLAIFIVLIQYCFVYSLLFPILKIVDIHFPKWSFLFSAIVWLAFEYVKTLGFLGYPYGIIGYSQWSFPTLIRVSSIFGVWIISFILVLCSSIIAELIINNQIFRQALHITHPMEMSFDYAKLNKFYRKAFSVWCGVFIAFILYGVFAKIDYSQDKKLKLALIQPNAEPWLGNIEVYKQNFNDLCSLSKSAMEVEPNLDLVVWPETAFIPRIKWHYKYAENSKSSLLVRDLLTFIDASNVPFLIGNDDAVYDERFSASSDFESGRVDYNAALLFIPKKNTFPPNPTTYHKMNLVPFTEYFPYKNIFPGVYKLLLDYNTLFWEKGNERTVFEIDEFKFGTPICFEDCFAHISRDFIKSGAHAIINLTNDAWAKSLTSQYQHFSMAVFRAVENRVPVLRAAISGQTCHIDQNGKVVSMLEPFTSDFLIVEVPVNINKRQSLYLVLGDFFAVCCLAGTVVLLVLALVRKIKK